MLLLILASVQFNHIVDFMILMPLGPQLMRIFDISPQQFSWLVACYTVGAGFSGFASSFITDLFDRKKLLLGFFFGFSIGTIACGLAPNYMSLMTARLLTGIFGGVLNSIVLAIVSDAFPYSKRGMAMGVISTSFSVASVAGVPLALYLTNIWNWHAGFLFLGSLSLLVLLFIFKWVPNQNKHLQQAAKRDLLLPLKNVLKTSEQLWALLFAGALVLGQFMVIPFLSPSLVSNAGLSEESLPLIYLIGGALTLVSGPFVGRMSDRYGKHKVFIFGLASSLVPTLIITHVSVLPTWEVLMITGLFFICVNARWVPALAMISGSATPQFRGSFMSYVGSVQQFAAALGSMIAGAIIFKDELNHLINYNVIGYISVTVSLIALGVSFRVRVMEYAGDKPHKPD